MEAFRILFFLFLFYNLFACSYQQVYLDCISFTTMVLDYRINLSWGFHLFIFRILLIWNLMVSNCTWIMKLFLVLELSKYFACFSLSCLTLPYTVRRLVGVGMLVTYLIRLLDWLLMISQMFHVFQLLMLVLLVLLRSQLNLVLTWLNFLMKCYVFIPVLVAGKL